MNNTSLFDIIPMQPENPSLNYERGEVYLEQGEYEEALKYFALAAKESDPNSLECAFALWRMGVAYFSLKQDETALSYFNEAQAINNNYAETDQGLSAAIFFGFAGIDWNKKDYNKAREWCFKSLESIKLEMGEVPPEFAVIHCVIGLTYVTQNNHSEGLTQFQEAYRISLSEEPFKEWLKKCLQNCIEPSDDLGGIFISVAIAYGIQKNDNEAISFGLTALEILKSELETDHSDIILLRIFLGAVYYRQEKYDECEAQWEEAYRISQSKEPYEEWLSQQLDQITTSA